MKTREVKIGSIHFLDEFQNKGIQTKTTPVHSNLKDLSVTKYKRV